MNEEILFISEEHIGANASPAEAKRVCDLLRVEDWKVAYGDRPWQFEDDSQRTIFEQAFQWAVDVITAEREGLKEDVLIGLVKQRFGLNKKLKAQETILLREGSHWPRYYHWLLETPSDVILTWLEGNEKDVPKG